MVLKLTNVNDQSYIKNLLPDNNAALVDILPALSAGERLVVGDAVPLPATVKMEMPSPIPSSSDVRVYDEWNKDWVNIVFRYYKALAKRMNINELRLKFGRSSFLFLNSPPDNIAEG